MHTIKEVLGAVYRKDVNILNQLSPQDVELRDGDGRTLLMHAILAEDADISIVNLLIKKGVDINEPDLGEKWTALHFAARDQNQIIVHALLEAGAIVDSLDIFGNTPLWRSVMNVSDDISTIRELISYRANPGIKNKSGVAPIDIAKETGRDDILELFEKSDIKHSK